MKLLVRILLFISITHSVPSRSELIQEDVRDIHIGLRVEFAFAYSTIFYKDYETIKNFAELLKNNPNIKIALNGHTDWIGPDSVNQELSYARSESVKDLLVKYGVEENRLITKGFSEDYPIEDNRTAYGRARNRRVVAALKNVTAEQAFFLLKDIKKYANIKLVDQWGKGSRLTVRKIEKKTSPSLAKRKTPPKKMKVPLRKKTLPKIAKQTKPKEKTKILKKEPKKRTPASSPQVSEVSEKIDVKKTKRDSSLLIAAQFGPNHTSNYYGNDIFLEHGKISYSSVSLELEYKYNDNIYISGYANYLPSTASDGDPGFNFSNIDSYDYENNLYGIKLGYDIKTANFLSDLSLELGYNTHFLGQIKRISTTDYIFQKSNHTSIGLGLRYNKRLNKKWGLQSRATYLYPLNVSDVNEFNANTWFQMSVGATRNFSDNLKLRADYKAHYYETELNFSSGFTTSPEYLIQVFMLGLEYKI